MKTTFDDGETRRLLGEFAAVCFNRIDKAKTTNQAIRAQNKTVKEYSKRINGWVHSKIKWNYGAMIVKDPVRTAERKSIKKRGLDKDCTFK